MGDMEFTTNIILEGRLATARVMVECLMELTAHVVKVARGPSDFMAGVAEQKQLVGAVVRGGVSSELTARTSPRCDSV